MKKNNKTAQIKLSKKIEVLVEKRVGSYFSFSHNGTDTSVTLVISTSDERYIKRARTFLKNYKLPRRYTKKTHGSGMKNTILVNVSAIPEETKKMIEEDFGLIAFGHKPKVTETISEDKVVKVRSRKDLTFYPFLRFLSSIFSFEGLDSSLVQKTRKGSEIKIEADPYTIDIVARATSYYFGEKVLSQDRSFNLNLDGKEICQIAKDFKFTLPPVGGESVESVLKRLCRVFLSRKYKVDKKESGYQVSLRSNKLDSMVLALLDMGWNIEEASGEGFFILTVKKKVESTDSKEGVYQELISFSKSEDFELLESSLKEEVARKITEHEKALRAEGVKAYALSLLSKLS